MNEGSDSNMATGFHYETKIKTFRTSLLHLPMILEPNLHLRGGQSNDRGEVFPLGCREVPLLPEPPFQLVGLRLREKYPSFPLLVAAVAASRLLLRGFLLVTVLFGVLGTGIAAVATVAFRGGRSL